MADDMQISSELCSFFRDEKAIQIESIRKDCEMKALSKVEQTKAWDPFRGGKHTRDLYAELLIPRHLTKEWERQGGELRALKTLGDGNCLYRACSKMLCGKDQLWHVLRMLTSIELFNNQQFYAFHPFIKEKSHLFHCDNTAFSAAVSDEALAEGYDRKNPSTRTTVVQREALRTTVSGKFSSLLCMLALSSVTGMNIRTVYPEKIAEKTKYSQFMNGIISPRAAHTKFSNKVMQHPLVFLWSSLGTITTLPGMDSNIFQPNHFVPLLEFKHKESHVTESKCEQPQKVRQQLKITDVLKSKGNIFEDNPNNLVKDATTNNEKPQNSDKGNNSKDLLTAAGVDAKKLSSELLKRKVANKDMEIAKKLKLDASDIDPLDVGNFVGNQQEIDDDTKFDIIKNHWRPSSTFNFPSREYGSTKKQFRKFSPNWFSRWSWLCYSKLYDGAFCLSCVLFGRETGRNGTKLVKLFKEPLTNWQSAVRRLEDHEKSSLLHRDSMLQLQHFNNVMSGKTKGIREQADSLRNDRIQYNRRILGAVVETVILSGRQNIALRGHRDDSQHYDSANPGNFQALLNYRISGGDKTLEEHFHHAKKNATYRSKTTQNKLVEICGKIVERKIVSEINSSSSPFYSVLADEASDCGRMEQMSLVLRYVDSRKEINERFIRYTDVTEDMTGLGLAENIESSLQQIGLPLENIRGQGYDGASAMASERKGVSGRILSKNPKALYVHCSSHRLNLVIAKACSIRQISNMMKQAQSIATFFSASPIRSQYLSKIMLESGLTRKKLKAPSTTRWVERISSLDGFLEAFEAIFKALDQIRTGGDDNKKFNKSASEAEIYWLTLKRFEFVVALVITTNIFDHTLSLTVQLQQRKIDISESLKQIHLLKSQMAMLRDSVEHFHNKYYDEALQLATKIGLSEWMPRLCKVQTKRENFPSETARDYYRLKFTIPLLDHIIAEIESRFPSEMCNLYNGFYILPSNFLRCKGVNWKAEFMKFMTAYKDDMPNFRSVHAELDLWETSWKTGLEKNVYDNVADTLQNCNELSFPNIFVALKILAIIPVTTCECERSISALRRMKTWLRNTMSNERLTGLAMMHINNDISIEVEEVIDIFARQNPTRMQFLNIFEDDVNA